MKKIMKKIISILVLTVIFCYATTAFAALGIARNLYVMVYNPNWIDVNIEIVLYGDLLDSPEFIKREKLEFPDAKPFLDEKNRVQVPIRAISEAFGADVEYDETSRTVSVKENDIDISFEINSDTICINGIELKMDTTAVIVNDYAYVPIRCIGELFGYTVAWGKGFTDGDRALGGAYAMPGEDDPHVEIFFDKESLKCADAAQVGPLSIQ